MSLIPYSFEGGRQIVLRHDDSVVIYDPQSRQLALQDARKDVELANCPYCHRPLHDEEGGGISPDRNRRASSQQGQPSFVNPEYFRMLHGSNVGSAEPSAPPSPHRRLAQPARSSTPLRASESLEDVSVPPQQAHSHGISAAALSPGYFERFFVVDRELGRGGKGVVLLVSHVLDGVPLGKFACKRIPVGDDHAWLEKVLFEVQLLQNLSHQNLVSYRHVWLENAKVNNFGPSVPCAFILQQYCNAGDLLHYMYDSSAVTTTAEELKNRIRRQSRGHNEAPKDIQASRRLSFDEIYSFFKDIASGLNYLHKKGYIHRDLKPSNCLLHDTGTEIRVLVSDFGEVQQEDVLRKSTGTTGTISYCAPEVLQRTEPSGAYGNFTTKSDVFSLGMILYFMCFGRLPYSNSDSAHEEDEDIDQLREEIGAWSGFDDNSASKVRSDLPEKLYRFLKRLLHLDPAFRPTAEEILVGISTGGSGSGIGDSSPGLASSSGSILEEIRSDSPRPQGGFNRTRPLASNIANTTTTSSGVIRAPSSRLRSIAVSPERRNSSSPPSQNISREPSSPSGAPPSSTSSSIILRPRGIRQNSLTLTSAPKLLPPPSLRPPPLSSKLGRFFLPIVTDLGERLDLLLVAKSLLFVGKVMSLSQLCWPYYPNEWLWWPLFVVAMLEFGYQNMSKGATVLLGLLHIAACLGAGSIGRVCHRSSWVLTSDD